MNVTLAGGSIQSEAPAQTEEQVRSTLDPIRDDAETSEMQTAPDYNEFRSDESGELTGLARRLVGSDTHPREKYVPWWRRFAVGRGGNLNSITDDQVATSGTAARREERGEQGHGTMQYAIGIEPEIRDGARYGNDYFVVHPKTIQEGAGAYMQPDETQNQWAIQVAAARSADASRAAYRASLYSGFLG